jgi:hypothetical protein
MLLFIFFGILITFNKNDNYESIVNKRPNIDIKHFDV